MRQPTCEWPSSVGQGKASMSALSRSDDPQVEKAVDRVHELLDEAGSFELNGNRDELQEIAHIVHGLSPTEREALLAQLSDEDLRTLQQHMQGTSDVLWRENGLPQWERLDLESSLLSAVSGQGVDRLSSVWPSCNRGRRRVRSTRSRAGRWMTAFGAGATSTRAGSATAGRWRRWPGRAR